VTIDLRSYDGLDKEYAHQVIDHAVEYVRGNVHTNGCENFWTLLKRGINGTYVSVEPFHLFRYVDEQAFRFNNRKDEQGDAGRFAKACSQAAGRRLTWKDVTGQAPIAQPQQALAPSCGVTVLSVRLRGWLGLGFRLRQKDAHEAVEIVELAICGFRDR
jgi:hypothetical protein